MRAEILAALDAARDTLESLAAFAVHDPETRVLQDAAGMQRYGVETLVPRWIRRPLAALRTYEEARRDASLAGEAARDQLTALEAQLAGLRAGSDGGEAKAEALEQQAARLLCFEADVRERLAEPDAELVETARQGITRVLEVSLAILARATIRYADAALDGEPDEARLALNHVESYIRFVERAHAVTGDLDVPALRPDYVAGLQRRAGPARRPSRRGGANGMVFSQRP